MADLTTIAIVKQLMNITVAGDDTIITKILGEVSVAIEEYCGRILAQQIAIVELHEMEPFPELLLNDWPVDNLVVVEGVTTLVAADYRLKGAATKQQKLIRLSGGLSNPWASGFVEVTYDAGYATVPNDIVGWAAVQTTHRLNGTPTFSGQIGLLSRDNETGAADFSAGSLLPEVKEGLEPHRRSA